MNLNEVNKVILDDCAKVGVSSADTARVYFIKQLSKTLKEVISSVSDIHSQQSGAPLSLTKIMDIEIDDFLEQINKTAKLLGERAPDNHMLERIKYNLETIENRIDFFILKK